MTNLNTHEPRTRAVTRTDRQGHKQPAPRGRTVVLLALLCAALVIGVAGGAVAQQSEAEAKKATEKLFQAAEVGNLAGVQASITAGGDMNAVDYRGLTPADVAADRGHFNVVHFLLSVRNVRRTIDGSTPAPLAATTTLPPLLATPPAAAPPPGVPRSAPSLPVLSAPLSASPPPQPIGPQGQPNPFNPSTVALGSTLPVIAEPAPAPTEQPMLGMAMEMEAPLQPTLGAVVAEIPAPAAKAETPSPARPTLGITVGERQERLSKPLPPPPDVVAMAQAPPAAEEKPAESGNLFTALGKLFKTAGAEDEQVAKASQEQAKEQAKARPSPLPIASLPAIPLPANHLTGRTLAIGASGGLGAPEPTDGKGRSCVTRRSGAMALCVEPLKWPAELEKTFSVKSSIYDGAKAIVRYDAGKATRFHVLFPTDSFDAVVAHFTDRFGPPTRTGTPPLKALGTIGQKNRTAAWVNLDPATKAVSALEIRAIDDIRGSLPDTRHGVVILIPGRAAPILPRRALLQLMMRKAGA